MSADPGPPLPTLPGQTPELHREGGGQRRQREVDGEQGAHIGLRDVRGGFVGWAGRGGSLLQREQEGCWGEVGGDGAEGQAWVSVCTGTSGTRAPRQEDAGQAALGVSQQGRHSPHGAHRSEPKAGPRRLAAGQVSSRVWTLWLGAAFASWRPLV